MVIVGDPVAQWIRHLTTDQGIPGSNPGRVVFVFNFVYSTCTYVHNPTGIFLVLHTPIIKYIFKITVDIYRSRLKSERK